MEHGLKITECMPSWSKLWARHKRTKILTVPMFGKSAFLAPGGLRTLIQTTLPSPLCPFLLTVATVPSPSSPFVLSFREVGPWSATASLLSACGTSSLWPPVAHLDRDQQRWERFASQHTALGALPDQRFMRVIGESPRIMSWPEVRSSQYPHLYFPAGERSPEGKGWSGRFLCCMHRRESHTQRTSFPGGSVGKESACNAGDQSLIPGWGRSPGEGNGKPTPVFLPGEFRG